MNAYLDNAATTFPKPECVPQAMYEFMTTCGANVGRGSYASAFDIEGVVLETREALAALFGAPDARDIAFTRNVTESLNLLIKGLLCEGDHVIVSSMEHNAVMRPLVQLESHGVSFTRCPCDETGMLDVGALAGCLQPNTRAVVMLHASNVTGTVMPVAKVGEFCRKHGLVFILDAAQTAGVLPIDMGVMGVDAVAFTGHKGLLGPQGIGGVALTEELAHRIEPLVVGGTGSVSDQETIPRFMPDRLEAGTPNLPGIVGLHAALGWHAAQEKGAVLAHELGLTQRFLDGLELLERAGHVHLCGRHDVEKRVGVVSLATPGRDEAEVATLLDEFYHISVRVGLHCAPSAHKTIGTFPTGTVRFSFGCFNSEDDVDYALRALAELLERC
jgi:cysteine desulfurase family protein